MVRLFVTICVTLASVFAASNADSEIADLARRIEMLSAKESVWPRVDTELRAAELLKDLQPAASGRFRDDAIRLFASHKELAPTVAMTGSLVALAPDRATALVLSHTDRRSPYLALIEYYRLHKQPEAADSVRKMADAEGIELGRHPAARPAPAPDPIAEQIRAIKPDLPESEKRRMIEDALAHVSALDTAAQQGPIASLLNRVEELKLDREALEPVAAQFLHVLEHSRENPDDYDWLSALRRQYDLSTGGDNASVRSRDALAQLAELVSTDYDFLLDSLDGKPVTLKGQRGKVVLLNFWATWCPRCREEMPMFEKLYRELGSSGFVLLAVTDEEPDVVRSFIKKNGYTFPILLDPGRVVFDHYRVGGIPATKILDRTGRLRAEVSEIAEPELRKLLGAAGLD